MDRRASGPERREERGPAGRGALDLKTDQPHTARMYDYYLGGKDHFPADREAAEAAIAAFPNARTTARQNRAFMNRTVRYLAGEAGIRQFLDIGTGIPTSPNLHEVAQEIVPEARIVYTDNDPIVLAHARALLVSTPQGRTTYVEADLRDVERILEAPQLSATLDLSRPVALSMVAIGHFIPDVGDPYGIVRRFLAALPSGSYLVLSHGTADHDPGMEQMADIYRGRGIPFRNRNKAEVERFFDGLELVDPGVVLVHYWRPDGAVGKLTDMEVGIYGGVALKP
ncbi:SAM-dependent methyltransferase [Frankia canadensis]|uniref:SAM-dependent methyltransferase n=1 Tax=Frankia canadensis TaxID=1836972 RepID=UPI003C2E7914